MSILQVQLSSSAPSVTFTPAGATDQAVNVNVSGTYGACSLAFEQSDDNSNTFYPLSVLRRDTGAQDSSHALNANTGALFVVQNLATGFALRVTANPAPATGAVSVSFTSFQQTDPTITGGGTIRPSRGKLVDRSGSLVQANRSQQLMAANANRRYLFIQNIGMDDLWINFTNPAVSNQPSVKLPAGTSFTMEGGFVSTEAISVVGTIAGQVWTAKEG